MYCFFAIFLLFLLLILFTLIIFHFRKRRIIQKLCRMTELQKCRLLNELAEPLGYSYDIRQDVFTSTTDAWQKEFGYGAAYDTLAPLLNMVIDSQPVYFDYDGKTWLVEFWKGQYGINSGCELGVYHADRILSPSERNTAIFPAIGQDEYMDLSIELLRGGRLVAAKRGRHWWQTIFCMGIFLQPRDLFMNIRISFPDTEMRNAFVEGLVAAGYDVDDICLSVCHTEVSFGFDCPLRRHGVLRRLYNCLVQKSNKFCCRLYRHVTRPFTCTHDRLLYLYFYLPFAFRRMLRLRRYRHHSSHSIRKRR